VLENARIAVRLPAQDLERARRFYAEKLGLHPIEEREGGLRCFRDSEGNLLGIGEPFRD
jgi:catechol 2,3-dioxygenase-like lactoylglutathione lyase family enzyme